MQARPSMSMQSCNFTLIGDRYFSRRVQAGRCPSDQLLRSAVRPPCRIDQAPRQNYCSHLQRSGSDYYFAPGGVRSIVMSMSVRLSVCSLTSRRPKLQFLTASSTSVRPQSPHGNRPLGIARSQPLCVVLRQSNENKNEAV